MIIICCYHTLHVTASLFFRISIVAENQTRRHEVKIRSWDVLFKIQRIPTYNSITESTAIYVPTPIRYVAT